MKKKTWSSPLGKAQSNAPAVIDRYDRCNVCVIQDTTSPEPVGTLLIRETLKVRFDDIRRPYVDIGIIARCSNMHCKRPIDVTLTRAAMERGVKARNVEALLRSCSGVPNFFLDELLSGSTRAAKLPPSVESMLKTPDQAATQSSKKGAHDDEIPF